MGIFSDLHISHVNHYMPLHYLPFIARSKALLSKPSLLKDGFGQSHLRSKSKAHDTARGFGQYAFLTLDNSPRIVKAKLAAGFPHIGISVPAELIETSKYSLCRFNVAMTRYLRRNGRPGFPESSTNGRYYGKQQIPVAQTGADKAALLQKHLKNTMIEVLIHGDLALTDSTSVLCYSEVDTEIAKDVLKKVGSPWKVTLACPPGEYLRRIEYGNAVRDFIERAMEDPLWRGNGLEFDRV